LSHPTTSDAQNKETKMTDHDKKKKLIKKKMTAKIHFNLTKRIKNKIKN
jgi:hypothetical protein